MEELGKRILEGRAFQKKVVGMVLSVLARAAKVAPQPNPMVSREIDTFPEDFVFILGIFGSRHPVICRTAAAGSAASMESVEAVCRKVPSPLLGGKAAERRPQRPAAGAGGAL